MYVLIFITFMTHVHLKNTSYFPGHSVESTLGLNFLFPSFFFFLTSRTYTKETPWNIILLKRKKNMFQSYILQKIFLMANTHGNTSKCKCIFFSPSIKKESVEGDEPMDCNSSSEWDLHLQVFPSLSDSKDVPDLLKVEGGRRVSSSSSSETWRCKTTGGLTCPRWCLERFWTMDGPALQFPSSQSAIQ